MAITLRNTKGAPLTHVEMDTNFNELDTRLTTVEGGGSSLNDLSDVDTTGAINGSVIKYDGANWVIGVDLDVANPFDQTLNTTDSVTFNGITSTAGNSFNGTTTTSIASALSYPSFSSPFVIENTGSDTVAFQMNVVGNDVDFINDNGTLRIKSGTSEVFSVNGIGTVTATSFVGDGSSLTGIPAGYTDSDVDTHLNTGTATSGQVLSWNGTDYAWIVGGGGSSFDQTLNTTDDVTFNSVTTGALTVNGAGTSTIQSGNNIVLDATNRVLVSDTPFRLASLTTTERDAIAAPENGDMIYNSTLTLTQIYENGSWVSPSISGIELTDLSVGAEDPAAGDGGIAYDNTTGIFTYTPPDLSSYLTAETDTLDSVILRGATTTTTAIIPFYYANQAAFPDANTYHGSIAHSHTDGAMYFAHGGVWNELANASDVGIQLTDLSVGAEDPAAGDGGIAYDNTTGVFTYTPPDLSSYLTAETDPVVGAITGIVKADGAGNISAAVEGTDYTLANQALDTTSNVTFNQLQVDSSITENNYTLTGTSVALDPVNGTIQTHTLTGPTTYTDSLADGQSVTLLIPATANTITWPTMKWQNGVIAQPDATNDTFISIFKVGTTLYGATIGVFI